MKAKLVAVFVAALAAFLAPFRRYYESTLIFGVVSLQDFQQGRVVQPGQSEALRWSFYDFQIYPAAGQTEFNFFQLPVGQGVTSAPGAVAGTTKTFHDTNMQLAGQMPRFFDFLLKKIEFFFFPGSLQSVNTFSPKNIATVHADPIVAADLAAANDVNTVALSGLVVLRATDKDYIREALLLRFPPSSHLGVSASITAVATSVGEAIYADRFGAPYYVEPSITLQANQNFTVQLTYPAAIALPSTNVGRIGCVMSGTLKRAVQ